VGGQVRSSGGARRSDAIADGQGGSDAALAAFLTRCRLLVEEGIIWGPASRFLCRAYAADELPPLGLVTSVRCILLRANTVLALARAPADRDEAHIVPGGRREPGETPEQTMRRELLEETGWEVGAARLLGVVVFRHQAPRPSGYPFPYPQFVQVIYTANALAHRPEAMIPDEIDGEAVFIPVAQAHEMRISSWQRAFLRLALAASAGGEAV
jgi:ADP-ribose pyrophosphatase YjhB (NUDIX family)